MTDNHRGGSLDALSAEIGATFLSSLKGSNELDKYEGSLAMTLLRSSDQKVVEAAKRIFLIAMEKEEKAIPKKALEHALADIRKDESEEEETSQKTTENTPTAGPVGNNTKPSSKHSPTGFSNHATKRSKSPTTKSAKEDSNKKQALPDRTERRERNRMHARKTRQRKKEHMKCLKDRADELKQKHLLLRQQINDKQTADILLVMGAGGGNPQSNIDPKVDALLKRPVEDIPDAGKIQELPTLYLPGHHNKKPRKKNNDDVEEDADELQNTTELADDINYELLKKDRSKCSPAELDQIRKERNRMHAKRTRDRKRLFMEEMESLIKQLEEDNLTLENYWVAQGGTLESSDHQPPIPDLTTSTTELKKPCVITSGSLQSLLAAVDCAEQRHMSSIASAVSASTTMSRRESVCEEDNESVTSSPHSKRARLMELGSHQQTMTAFS